MIFQVDVPGAYWATVVIRAPAWDEARRIALETVRQYGDYEAVELELLDPDGPAGVLIEDWS